MPESKASKTARAMVGDGKLPNKYWVSVSTSYLTNKDGPSDEFGGAEDVYKDLPEKGETFGPYATFAEALSMAEQEASQMSSPADDWDGYHSVTIEDRLSGNVYEGVYLERWKGGGCFPSVTHKWEWSDDTGYTRKEMAKRGATFE